MMTRSDLSALKKIRPISYLLWGLIILSSFLAACSNQTNSEKEAAFHSLFPDISFNKEFRASIVRNEVNLKEGPFLFIGLENLSSSAIGFSREDFGVRILYYSSEQNQWKEIENDIDYITEAIPKLFPKDEGPLRFLDITLSPILENNEREMDIRIVIIGTIYEDDKDTGKQVGAYTDLTLAP